MAREQILCCLVLAATLVLAACVHPAPAPTPLAGGWQSAPVDDAARDAAVDAVAAQAAVEQRVLDLRAVEAVSRQVVAGLNYRMALRVARDGAVARAEATVFQNLDGQRTLVAWRWLPAP